ncbi:MAG: hypothetical protein K0R50_249 [Eubacterium sp.]|jgi:hypothetical protein|nr:hypothetical protein [Eubacterium sp.]
MEKVKKSIFKRWWFWTIVVVVILAAVGGQVGKDTKKVNAPIDTSTAAGSNIASTAAESSTAEKSSVIESINPKTKIEFKNIFIFNEMGFTTVIGEANNTDSKLHTFTLKVSFYDKNKELLGSAVGAVSELNGGETKVFTALAVDDYSKADSYKVQVDDMLSSSKNKTVPIEFSNIVLKDNKGLPFVEGQAKNTDTSAHSFTIVIGLYDANEKLIGTAAGAINDIAAGDTMTFTAMGTNSLKGVKNYKVQVDTMVK